MLTTLTIKNFKSVADLKLDLGRINVFIGENGCGKTNILEALAMLAASWNVTRAVGTDDLYSRGCRVAKPSITFSSFKGRQPEASIQVDASLLGDIHVRNELWPKNADDIYAEWGFNQSIECGYRSPLDDEQARERWLEWISDYLIFNLNIRALRGIAPESHKLPLGIHGEGLDVLIASFSPKERKRLLQYTYFISWLDNIVLDKEDRYKFQGHKLGKSASILYFKDRFMRQRNNVFSAENANEGVLHVLFYLALFVSKRTPALLGIDNIETSLNPRLCRTLMKELGALAKESDKQALITTHNPAVLDGLNLHDDEQRLFVVYRGDEGDTRARRIKMKEKVEVDGETLMLSELWMRGYLGGIPQNF